MKDTHKAGAPLPAAPALPPLRPLLRSAPPATTSPAQDNRKPPRPLGDSLCRGQRCGGGNGRLLRRCLRRRQLRLHALQPLPQARHLLLSLSCTAWERGQRCGGVNAPGRGRSGVSCPAGYPCARAELGGKARCGAAASSPGRRLQHQSRSRARFRPLNRPPPRRGAGIRWEAPPCRPGVTADYAPPTGQRASSTLAPQPPSK